MRPRTLDEFVGQEHPRPGKLLCRAIEADRLPSVILSGPPGTGKTTLAQIIAEMTNAEFVRLSGVESNVAEMRRVIAAATNRRRNADRKTILFIDEIHHFNKAQQDILLPDVEKEAAADWRHYLQPVFLRQQRPRLALPGVSTATVESRATRAPDHSRAGRQGARPRHAPVKMEPEARQHLAKLSDGDARKCLNALEIGVLTIDPGREPAVSSSSRSRSPKKAFSKRPSSTTARATRITTRSPPSSRACAPPMKKRDVLAGKNVARRRRLSLHCPPHRYLRERGRWPG